MMAAIFLISSLSDPPSVPRGVSDKTAHAITYAGLGVLALRACAGGRWRDVNGRSVLSAVAIATLYGITDEWHQSFVPRRSPEAADVVFDALGAAAAVGVCWACGIIARRHRVDPTL